MNTKEKVLRAIKVFATNDELAPTIRMIADKISMSYTTVWIYMKELKAEGKIDFDYDKSSMIKVVQE